MDEKKAKNPEIKTNDRRMDNKKKFHHFLNIIIV